MIDELDLEILKSIYNTPTTVYGIAKTLKTLESLANYHIKKLQKMKLVKSLKKSRRTLYSANKENVCITKDTIMLIESGKITIYTFPGSEVYNFIHKKIKENSS